MRDTPAHARGRARPRSRARQSQFADLRRRRSRELVERVLARAEHLAPRDRDLVLAHYRDARSAVEIARLSASPPRAVRRRLKILVRRLHDPAFAFVARSRQSWSPTRRRVATACWLEGRSMREASRRLGLGLHTVRRHCEAVRALCDAQEGSRP